MSAKTIAARHRGVHIVYSENRRRKFVVPNRGVYTTTVEQHWFYVTLDRCVAY